MLPLAMANARNNFLEIKIPSPTMNFKQRIDSRFGPGTSNHISNLESMNLNLVKHANHLTFLTKCKLENLVPTGLRLKCAFVSQQASKILDAASKSLVKERIGFHRTEKRNLQNKIESKRNELSETIGPELQDICKSIQNRCNKESDNLKNKHTRKLEMLRQEQVQKKPNPVQQQMDEKTNT